MITVPEKTIAAIALTEMQEQSIKEILQPLQGDRKRDWFIKHAYFCLPLTIGNQYGVAIKSLHTFDATWNGGNTKEDVVLEMIETSTGLDQRWDYQIVSSHFGMGTITIQNTFTLRTPPGVNLMTINPPNYWIDGIHHMTGVVEADNLRRDFTFNLKLTRPGHTVRINEGDLVGCILPVPRHFCDEFQIKNATDLFTEEQIAEERQCMKDFGVERSTKDINKQHGNGRRYFQGEDVYGNRFQDHQKFVKGRSDV